MEQSSTQASLMVSSALTTTSVGKMLDKPYLSHELMFWAFMIDMLIYLLIIATLLVFWIKYNKIEKSAAAGAGKASPEQHIRLCQSR